MGRIAEELESRGITVIIKGVRPEHLPLLTNVGAIGALRHENHLVDTLDEALAHARSHVWEQRRGQPVGSTATL